MILHVTGVQQVDFNDVHGIKVFGVVQDSRLSNMAGKPTATVWFAHDRADLIPDGFGVDMDVEMFFEQGKNTPAFCRLVV